MQVGVDYGFAEIDMQFVDERGQFGPRGAYAREGKFRVALERDVSWDWDGSREVESKIGGDTMLAQNKA